jgi:hypothetical protein
MHVLGVAAFVLSAGLNPPMKICMESGASDHWVVIQAKTITTRMFAEIGVGIEWRQSASCKPRESLIVQFSTGAPEHKFPGALAYANLSDGDHIEVFYDRVIGTVEVRRVPALLAHVLAHEIAHMLEGISRHSGEGVMKAHWNERDFLQMADKRLPFAPEDVDLIHRGVMNRAMDGRLFAAKRTLP